MDCIYFRHSALLQSHVVNTRLAIGARRQWVARTQVSFIIMVMHMK